MLTTLMHSCQSEAHCSTFLTKRSVSQVRAVPAGHWCWGTSLVCPSTVAASPVAPRRPSRAFWSQQSTGLRQSEIATGVKDWLGETSYLLMQWKCGMGRVCLLALVVSGGHTSCVCFKDLCKSANECSYWHKNLTTIGKIIEIHKYFIFILHKLP